MLASQTGFALILGTLYSVVYRKPSCYRTTVEAGAVFVLPSLFNSIYLYDFTALFSTTPALVLMARQKRRLYLVVFVLGCLTKGPFGLKSKFRYLFEVYPVGVLIAAYKIPRLAGVSLTVRRSKQHQ